MEEFLSNALALTTTDLSFTKNAKRHEIQKGELPANYANKREKGELKTDVEKSSEVGRDERVPPIRVDSRYSRATFL